MYDCSITPGVYCSDSIPLGVHCLEIPLCSTAYTWGVYGYSTCHDCMVCTIQRSLLHIPGVQILYKKNIVWRISFDLVCLAELNSVVMSSSVVIVKINI